MQVFDFVEEINSLLDINGLEWEVHPQGGAGEVSRIFWCNLENGLMLNYLSSTV